MKTLKALCVASLLVLLAGCGGMGVGMNSGRVLQSMTITPATADAQNFANGQVTFTATGTFSKPPSPDQVTFVAPYSGSWMVSDPNIATISTMNEQGVARCVPGASGTVTVTAIASANSTTMPGAMSTAVTATAKLTCP